MPITTDALCARQPQVTSYQIDIDLSEYDSSSSLSSFAALLNVSESALEIEATAGSTVLRLFVAPSDSIIASDIISRLQVHHMAHRSDSRASYAQRQPTTSDTTGTTRPAVACRHRA